MKEYKSIFYFFLILNCINLLFLAARGVYFMEIRPLVAFEYTWVILLYLFRPRFGFIVLIIALILFFDLVKIYSQIFFFNVPFLIDSLQFYGFYTINLQVLIKIVFAIIFLIIYFYVLYRGHQQVVGAKRGTILIFVFLSTLLIGLADIAGGSSGRFRNLMGVKKWTTLPKYDLAGTILPTIYQEIINPARTTPSPLAFESVSERFFSEKTNKYELLILLESWGSYQNNELNQTLVEIFKSNPNLKIEQAKTPFEGSTTNAEMREMIHRQTDYYAILETDSLRANTIFNQKKKLGYTTHGFHSFFGEMYHRNRWWPLAGIDSCFFYQKNSLISDNHLNKETPFWGLNDEQVLDQIFQQKTSYHPRFTYFLTLNSHLPFTPSSTLKASQLYKNLRLKFPDLDQGVFDQYARIYAFMSHLAILLKTNPKYHKILLIGDHAPPFAESAQKAYFDEGKVFYIGLNQAE